MPYNIFFKLWSGTWLNEKISASFFVSLYKSMDLHEPSVIFPLLQPVYKAIFKLVHLSV